MLKRIDTCKGSPLQLRVAQVTNREYFRPGEFSCNQSSASRTNYTGIKVLKVLDQSNCLNAQNTNPNSIPMTIRAGLKKSEFPTLFHSDARSSVVHSWFLHLCLFNYGLRFTFFQLCSVEGHFVWDNRKEFNLLRHTSLCLKWRNSLQFYSSQRTQRL